MHNMLSNVSFFCRVILITTSSLDAHFEENAHNPNEYKIKLGQRNSSTYSSASVSFSYYLLCLKFHRIIAGYAFGMQSPIDCDSRN